jgi:hypothetical protein
VPEPRFPHLPLAAALEWNFRVRMEAIWIVLIVVAWILLARFGGG